MKSEDLQESLNSLRDVYMPADRDREISANLQQEIARHRARRSRFARVLWFRQWGAVSAAVGIAVVLVAVLVPWRGMGAGQRSMQTASSTSDTTVLQSGANSARLTAAHVAVMNPIVGGPARPNPEIYTYVEPPKSLVKLLKVYVNLTGQTGTIFPPATLHVTSESPDRFSYAKDYVITKSDGPARQHVLEISVPPQSGKYTVSVSLAGKPTVSKFHPLPADIHGGDRLRLFNYGPVTMYVDHGGYYRTAVVPVNQTADQGNLAVTVTKVVMNQDATRVELHITGRDSHKGLQLWGGFEHAALTLSNGQTKELPLFGASEGPAMTTPRQGELDYEPMTEGVKSMHINFEYLVGPGGVQTKPFTFDIPLG